MDTGTAFINNEAFFPIELTVLTKPREALRKICKEKSFEPQKMNHTVLKSKGVGVGDQGGKSEIQQKNSPRIPTHTRERIVFFPASKEKIGF